MSNTAVVTNGNVDGNVSNCQLIKEITGVSRDGAFSLVQETSYSVMNSCTGEIQNSFSITEMTEFSVVSGIMLATILMVAIPVAIASRSRY